MSRRILSRILLCAALVTLAGSGAFAQTYGGYTPYSIFGVGDLANPGTAYNKSMGGVGIAARNVRFLNPLNPASVTARDTLAFMADYSMLQDNKIYLQGDMRSAFNTVNIGDLMISFPIYKSSAMMLGITPFSNTGFDYSYNITDPAVIGRTGNINYAASGMGGLYELYAAAGVTFWRRLSIGAEALYYFGKTKKTFYETFTDVSYNDASNGHVLQLGAVAGKFGLQYEQPLGTKASVTLGATYRTRAKLGGYTESYRFSTGTAATDTLYYNKSVPSDVYLASEIGAGLSVKYSDKLMVEVDYTRSDWRNTGLDMAEGFTGNLTPGVGRSAFSTSVSQAFRAGVEYTPNRNDIRYYMRTVTYRAGAYYKNEYFMLDGNPVNAFGVTLGVTFPVFRWHNGITFGMDFGQRGSLKNNMILERYVNFSLGFNLFDIWFQKFAYD